MTFIKTIVKTATFVTLFSVFERFLGFIYRIYLSRTIGSEGVGIYQIALTVFGLMLTITSSGIPITVSRMMTRYKAENNYHAVYSTVTSGIIFCLSTAIPITLAFYLFGNKLNFIFSDERCMNAFMILLPGLTITSVYAVIRGSFWGCKSFLPYSIIELLEEAVMLVAGIILINHSTSMLDGINRASYAVIISYIFSFFTSLAVFFIKGGRLNNPQKTLKPLILSATPITGMRITTSLINSFIAIILPAKLVLSGLSQTRAMEQFGAAFGMAIPILFMPGTLIGSIALVLVPELSENYYKKQNKNLTNNVTKAIKFSVMISCLIIPPLFAYGKNLGELFYKSSEAGNYIAFASPIMLPMSLCMISTSMLNSMNMEKKSLTFYLIGASLMLFSVTVLPYRIGIYSLFVGFLGQFLVTAILNLHALSKKTNTKPQYLEFLLKCVLFTIPSCLFGIFLHKVLYCLIGEMLACFIGCILTIAFNLAFYIIFESSSFSYLFKRK